MKPTTTPTRPGSTDVDSNRGARSGRLPGVEGIWVLIGVDSVVFALLFASFLDARRSDPGGFDAARQSLNADLGGVNTLVLLTSSWVVALAIQALRDGVPRRASRLLILAVGTGSVFVAVKSFEYVDKLVAGTTPATSDFFMWYFVLTGIHLVHVLLGIGLLVFVVVGVRRGRYGANRLAVPESVATFWHLVDLLWIVIFPLLYLMRAA
ncbi:cytochrome c oxidase subunit 3 family protein [Nocardioides sp. WS12]|uniref:cytochrome c oxidase subunit 3 family protein n=1 Tax=Nocardioides sp. WS12 TaxID=2486272 RepID=UPI0015FAA1E6|nr:cytochrome c oxidase subunit 3 family protein [Nocardioides sp. WS12]